MRNNTKIILITQARVGSSRLPGKVLKNICGQSILSIHLHRLKEAQYVKKIIVATTEEEGVENIIKIANQSNVKYSQGSTQDVLSRFYNAAFNEQPNYIVRVTSDCPLLDPRLVDEVIKFTVENELDYGSNMMIQNYPDGQDVEVFTFDALKLAHENAKLNSEREHVTPYIVKNSSFNGGQLFKSADYPLAKNYNHVRMTVDEKVDYDAVKILVEKLGINASWETYTNYIMKHPETFKNQQIIRNEGYLKSLEKEKNEE